MATAKANPPRTLRKPRTVGPAHGTTRLILEINGVPYRVRPIAVEARDVRKAFRLRKADGTAHDVAETISGHECSCGDWIYRRDGIDPAGCKHIKALRAWGLVSAHQGGAVVEANPADWPAPSAPPPVTPSRMVPS